MCCNKGLKEYYHIMQSVILCGGSGTRLWPLSRKNYPKQFLNLYSDKSLLQETFLRMRLVMPAQNIYFVTNRDNYYNVFNQVKEINPAFKEENIILEPTARNTLPAIALAVKYLKEKIKIPVDEQILFAPADHSILDGAGFAKVIKKWGSWFYIISALLELRRQNPRPVMDI